LILRSANWSTIAGYGREAVELLWVSIMLVAALLAGFLGVAVAGALVPVVALFPARQRQICLEWGLKAADLWGSGLSELGSRSGFE
jgi:hypothetical protein